MSRYRTWSSSSLRVWLRVFDKPVMRDVFWKQLVAIEHELLLRDLAAIADESGGFAVVAPKGWH